MPEGVRLADRHSDPYSWAMAQAALVRRGGASLKALDREALGEFLEEWADEMLSAVRSQIVNLMAHAAKAASSRNPDVIGHWRSECVEFHDRIVDGYRPSMHVWIDLAGLWRRARRKVLASFADHGEPAPDLSPECPFVLDGLVDPGLDIEQLVATINAARPRS
jgi:hypothetical protein